MMNVGIIGSGSFGKALAKLLAQRHNVGILCRTESKYSQLKKLQKDGALNKSIFITYKPENFFVDYQFCVFVIPSAVFRQYLKQLSPYINKAHDILHGTKGLDPWYYKQNGSNTNAIVGMTRVLKEETQATKIGCLAGPNLASEISVGLPAATVVAATSQELSKTAKAVLQADTFRVYTSSDVFGIELCGILKNIYAIAAGACFTLKMGENAAALLIQNCLAEMIKLGTNLGAEAKTIVGVAGLADLIATCHSNKSRNFRAGKLLANGYGSQYIKKHMPETAEGINTSKIIGSIAKNNKWDAPIVQIVCNMLYNNLSPVDGIHQILDMPLNVNLEYT